MSGSRRGGTAREEYGRRQRAVQDRRDDNPWSHTRSRGFPVGQDFRHWIHLVALGLGHHADLFNADPIEHCQNSDNESVW